MIDDIFVLFENSGKYFSSYKYAYLNSLNAGSNKQVYYVFTPTMQRCKRVCELENLYRKYFRENYDCSYFDMKTKTMVNQLNIFKEV